MIEIQCRPGLKSLKKNDLLPSDKIRREGGGRPDIIKTNDSVEHFFLKVIEDHIAGDPMNPEIRWINITRAQISEKMREYGIKVSRNIVRKLMKKHKLKKRKMQRKRATGKSSIREEQFENIISTKEKAMRSKNPVLSMDTKKKENVGGNLYRDGSVYGTQAIEVSDHDYPHLADGKIVPHGIYDMKQNKAFINIGISAETAEFICDSLKNWWEKHGKKDYPKAKKIIIFCDAGGANSYRHNVFKSELQAMVNKIKIPIKIVHYPPYASKWNPIEHRVFPHVTRALSGTPLNSIQEAKNKISSAKTKTGLTVVANIIKKTYRTGKEVAKDFIKQLKIKVGDSLPKLNYTIVPAKSNGM